MFRRSEKSARAVLMPELGREGAKEEKEAFGGKALQGRAGVM